jgi:hypothetical protein
VSHSNLSSDDDIEAILKIAVSQAGALEGRTLRERLMAGAEELGLTPEQVAVAEAQWARQEREKRELAEFRLHQRKGFWSHFASYVVVNSFLVAVNFMTDHRVDWAWWPILGWGIGIAFSAIATFFPKSESFQEELEKWREKRNRGELPEGDD